MEFFSDQLVPRTTHFMKLVPRISPGKLRQLSPHLTILLLRNVKDLALHTPAIYNAMGWFVFVFNSVYKLLANHVFRLHFSGNSIFHSYSFPAELDIARILFYHRHYHTNSSLQHCLCCLAGQTTVMSQQINVTVTKVINLGRFF